MNLFRLFLIFTLFISTCVEASSLSSNIVSSDVSAAMKISNSTSIDIPANFSANTNTDNLIKSSAQDKDSLEQQSEKEHLFVLPRIIRANATEFNALSQLNPNYFVEIEFFSATISAALFKNLVNPPLIQPWFIQQSFTGTKQRLSGWKESNTQFTARDPYSV